MIISPSSLDSNLSQLLDEVNSGKTQLPEFQRKRSITECLVKY